MSADTATDELSVVYRAADLRSLYGACRKCRRAFVWILLIPMLVGLSSYLDGYRGAPLAYQLLPYLLIGLTGVAALYFLVPLWQIRLRRKNGWGEPMSVRLGQDGLVMRHPSQDSVFHWSAIRDVVTKGNRLFLFTTPACAIILPRRVFASDEQFAQWSDRARSYWKAAVLREAA
jgi:hypothetical protein